MEAHQKTQKHLHISSVNVSYEALNPGSSLEAVLKVIWMELVSEYTGSGMFWPHSLKGLSPSFDAMLVISTKAPPGGELQSVVWPGSKVKFKKDNLIRPLGTVIVQTHTCEGPMLFGKLGLATNPLDAPLILTPAPQAIRS